VSGRTGALSRYVRSHRLRRPGRPSWSPRPWWPRSRSAPRARRGKATGVHWTKMTERGFMTAVATAGIVVAVALRNLRHLTESW